MYLALCDALGCKISESKSIFPEVGKPSAGEMSKTFFRDGIDLTPISPRRVREAFVDSASLDLLGVTEQVCEWFNNELRPSSSRTKSTLESLLHARRGGIAALAYFVNAPDMAHKYE